MSLAKKIVLILLVLLIGGFILLAFGTKIVWDGAFDLTVNLHSYGELPIRIYYTTTSHQDYAEQIIENTRIVRDPTKVFDLNRKIDPFDGQPIRVQVPISGEDTICHLTVKRSQHRWLVLIAEMENGELFYFLRTIPDSRKSREVKIDFLP